LLIHHVTLLHRNFFRNPKNTLSSYALVMSLTVLHGCASAPLEPWHTEVLDEEFSRDKTNQVQSFEDYQQLEGRLFKQLDENIYAHVETSSEYALDRYSPGSIADPRKYQSNLNRSFELRSDQPRGGVLLLHGMSDSPYVMRALGQALHNTGYTVVGMRMPGHGTAPSGLRYISPGDMSAAIRIGMAHLDKQLNGKPVHIIGYSNGATLAIDYTLDALEGKSTPIPDSLVLISPALGIHAAAGMARFLDMMSDLPGLDAWSYTEIENEFDPFKYNSFATNAADVVHTLTRSVARRIKERAGNKPEIVLPPVLVFKSTVDATVTTDAVIDNLLEHLNPNRHELVLFDINRHAAVTSRMLIADPAPFTNRVLNATDLPFSVTLVTNENEQSIQMVSKYFPPFASEPLSIDQLETAWPSGVISLSHVALPISPGDPVYGQQHPGNEDFIFLGKIAIQGERGLLKISTDWMLRLRYNPFYDYLESRTLDWINNASGINALNR
jgi:alpha-beta hydrolase superfamily lysophospholipase